MAACFSQQADDLGMRERLDGIVKSNAGQVCAKRMKLLQQPGLAHYQQRRTMLLHQRQVVVTLSLAGSVLYVSCIHRTGTILF